MRKAFTILKKIAITLRYDKALCVAFALFIGGVVGMIYPWGITWPHWVGFGSFWVGVGVGYFSFPICF